MATVAAANRMKTPILPTSDISPLTAATIIRIASTIDSKVARIAPNASAMPRPAASLAGTSLRLPIMPA